MTGVLIRVNDLTLTGGGVETWACTAELSYNGMPLAKDVTATDPAGRTILVYTSGYADFAGKRLPAGRIDATGILLKTGTRYRLKINDLTDVSVH